MTAVTASGWSLPVLVSSARTLSPGLSWLIGTALPEASSTGVAGVKEFPGRQAPAAASAVFPRAPTGYPFGTPQETLDCACGLYLGDATAWLNPPPPTN
jgi:hypothetical protein